MAFGLFDHKFLFWPEATTCCWIEEALAGHSKSIAHFILQAVLLVLSVSLCAA